MTPLAREIHKWGGSARGEVQDLLQAIFVAELLAPSRQLWVVSPWISDIEVIDNRDGRFRLPTIEFGHRIVHLSEVLARLLRDGCQMRVIARPIPENEPFLAALERHSNDIGAQLRAVTRAEELHTKGILGDDYFLSGSMNVTRTGITINDELLRFSRDPDTVAGAHAAFSARWDGVSHG